MQSGGSSFPGYQILDSASATLHVFRNERPTFISLYKNEDAR